MNIKLYRTISLTCAFFGLVPLLFLVTQTFDYLGYFTPPYLIIGFLTFGLPMLFCELLILLQGLRKYRVVDFIFLCFALLISSIGIFGIAGIIVLLA